VFVLVPIFLFILLPDQIQLLGIFVHE